MHVKVHVMIVQIKLIVNLVYLVNIWMELLAVQIVQRECIRIPAQDYAKIVILNAKHVLV